MTLQGKSRQGCSERGADQAGRGRCWSARKLQRFADTSAHVLFASHRCPTDQLTVQKSLLKQENLEAQLSPLSTACLERY